MAVTELIGNCGHKKHLEREKALGRLEEYLNNSVSPEALHALQNCVLGMTPSEQWERRLGGLKAAELLVPHSSVGNFKADLVQACLRQLEDVEVRVRLAVGSCLRVLAQQDGIRVWDACRDRVMHSILYNFERDAIDEPADADADGEGSPCSSPRSFSSNRSTSSDFLLELLNTSYQHVMPGTGELRHDTEGWKCLETSYKALQQIMDGCGGAFKPFVDDTLRQVLYTSLLHKNRFVRETGFFVLESVCKIFNGEELHPIGVELAQRLGQGLSDNWSQVRFAASVATRTFMLAAEDFRHEVYPYILPHMCLNRYYIAEGVRVYNQATWAMVMGDKGRQYVAQYAPEVVDYYVSQSKANNHAVREAACACMAEMMAKIDPAAVSRHVPRLLRALLTCFKDASWPVRDAACLACGRGVLAYPEESRAVLDELYLLWFAHLSDNISSVREDSAVALGNVVRAYKQEALDGVLEQLRMLLPSAKDQPPESTSFSRLSNVTRFGVAGPRTEQDDRDKFTNQQMFSCGSLAPKFSTSVLTRGGGCMDHGFARKKEPWESSDGGVYLLRELSVVAPQAVPEFLPTLADISRLDGFTHAHNLQETIWKQLPGIAMNIGKKAFKPFIESFVGPLFTSLRCGHRNTEVAAGIAIGSLRDMIGPNIFAGRLTPEQQRAMQDSPDVPPPSGALGGRVTLPPGLAAGRTTLVQ